MENVIICRILDCRDFRQILNYVRKKKFILAYDDVDEKDLGFMLYDLDYSDKENLIADVFQSS